MTPEERVVTPEAARRGLGGALGLTVLAAVAIVAALHARFHVRVARAESRAERMEGRLGERARREPGTETEGARSPVSLAQAWPAVQKPPPLGAERWVAPEGTRAQALGEQAVFPPSALRAEASERGVTLEWLPNERNPEQGITYEVYRWRESESVKPLGGETASLSLFDPEVCSRQRYSYCVVTVSRDRLEGVEVRRSRRSAPVSAWVPERYRIELLGVDAGRAHLRISVPATGRAFEASISAGEPIGVPEEPTGLVLEEIDALEREEEVEVRRPVFLPDGRRAVEDGREAFRTRLENRTIRYPRIRLRDGCGRAQTTVAPTGDFPN